MTPEARPIRTHGLSRRAAAGLLLALWLAMVGIGMLSLPDHPMSILFHDELLYAQQAGDVADGGFPRFNGIWQAKYPPLYSVLLAPMRLLTGRDGFAWGSRVVNVLLLTSVLLPAYRLARRQLTRGPALAAALVATLSPVLVYTRLLLSEVVLLPLFLWFVFLLVRLARAPSRKHALLAGGVFGLLFLTKTLVVITIPGIILALLAAQRSWRATTRTAGWAAASALMVVVPWVFRAWIFPSEAHVPPLYSYLKELTDHGWQPLHVYLYWLRAEPGCFVLALGTPPLTLGLLALVARRRDPDPSARCLAIFLLVSSLSTLALVTIWVSQVSYYAPKFQERYFVFLWPPFMVLFFGQLWTGRWSGRSLTAAAAVVVLLVLLMPDAYFDPGSVFINFADFPSSEQGLRYAAWTGGPWGARALLVLPLLALLLPGRWPRAGRLVVLALVIAYQIHGMDAAFARVRTLQAEEKAKIAPLWDWLERELEPGDLVVHHTDMQSVAFQTALHFEMELCFVSAYMIPSWDSPLKFDPETGYYTYIGRRPVRRLLLLTRDPGPDAGQGCRRFGRYRLLPLDAGLEALGHWLGPKPTDLYTEGDYPDHWCRKSTTLLVPAEYPGPTEIGMILSHPADSPVTGDLHLSLIRNEFYDDRQVLSPGDTLHLRWTLRNLWTPRIKVVIQADQDAVLDGRRVSFKIEGLYARPAPEGDEP